jgi:predicted HTH domain antitoxin
MSDTILEVRVPQPLLQLGLNATDVQNRLVEWLVFSLFTEGHISSGKAAKLLNISRIEFLALLRNHGIAYVDYTDEEINEELAAVKTLSRELNL